jgi:N-acylglucosamine-6-phosphate 2-epimerase
MVGIDGGQTSLRCVVCSTEGEVRSYVEMPSCSRILDRANRQEAEDRLSEAICWGLDSAGARPEEVAAVWIGMSGVPSPDSKPARLWEVAVRRAFPQVGQVHADSDVSAALYGAAGLAPGVVILSGTGSIAFGRDEAGRTARAGGWGYILGDEGSGYSIGMAGLKAVVRAQDGLAPATSLTRAVTDRLGLEGVYDLKGFIYSRRLSPSLIAGLSRTVSAAAAGGDRVAREIMLVSGRELADLVVSVRQQLQLDRVPTPVYPVGGVLSHEPLVRQSLTDALRRTAPLAVMGTPVLPAVGGAAICALLSLGLRLDGSFVERLRETLPPSPRRRDAERPRWDVQSLRRHLRHRLIVSCQATPPDYADDPYVLTCLAKAAVAGGAAAIRANGPDTIREMREALAVPILGINKVDRETNEVYITPTPEAAEEVIRAGADFIAVDCTGRPRPDGRSTSQLVAAIRERQAVPIMGDVSTLEEAVAAARMGVDFVATTLAGYTPYSNGSAGVDVNLIRAIAERVPVPVIAEGGVWTPEEAAQAIEAGAWSVVVGGAITRPRLITQRFVAALAALESRRTQTCTCPQRS